MTVYYAADKFAKKAADHLLEIGYKCDELGLDAEQEIEAATAHWPEELELLVERELNSRLVHPRQDGT